ncbi:dynein regulatory complex protein 10-like isoform X2 [Venturia canescens]|uniref:dynein regulatory complex protein 10-like isoform X2 n=1 Tax=Venturia canescens TaxID=32260 RepID=UPI001C9C7F88|nr:dynein regulatory complex protein 10-like isoform X2 [Venturia canescens]
MSSTYTKCKPKLAHRYQPSTRGAIDPESCPCVEVAAPQITFEEAELQDTAEAPSSPKTLFENIDKPPVDELEIIIFLERILNLFGQCMEKLELVAALPIILEDSKMMEIIGTAEFEKIKSDLGSEVEYDDGPWLERRERWQRRRLTEHRFKVEGHLGVGSSSSVSRKSSDEEETTSSESACTGEALANSKIYKALELLSSFTAVREKVKTSILANDIDPQSNLFLQHVKYFIEHCIRRVRFDPVREKLRNDFFRNLWHENHKAQRDIDGLLDFLDEQRMKNHDLTKQIAARYRKDCETVESFDGKCIEDIKSTVELWEKKQISEIRYAELRRNDLNQYLAIVSNKLDNLHEANRRAEEEIRSKRFKVMSQLSSQIAKFDTEVGERYRILEELVAEFDANEETRKNLEEETKRQSDECDIFLAEIEEQRMAIILEKLEAFARNRAAKIIQRWWRPIYKRRKKRRREKKKKGKKKKKK